MSDDQKRPKPCQADVGLEMAVVTVSATCLRVIR
jgi:hypothetical protein